MTHSAYILAAYLASAIVVGGLALWVIFDNRVQRRRLQQLEAEGVGRRSESAAERATGQGGASAQTERMMVGISKREPTRGGGKRLLAMLPVLAFFALAVLFYARLGAGDPSRIPSALINKPVPDFSLPLLEGVNSAVLDDEALGSGLHVVNVWASWCQPCRSEHPVLMELAKDERFQMAGLNYKDVAENARRFLGSLGNPYRRIGTDPKGRSSIDWGVYGVPETFIVKDGVIVYKFIGPLSETTVKSDFLPAIEKAISGQTE